jgi:hypothetical protein
MDNENAILFLSFSLSVSLTLTLSLSLSHTHTLSCIDDDCAMQSNEQRMEIDREKGCHGS